MKGTIPKTPSPLALAIRANVERAARGLARSTELLREIASEGNPPGFRVLDQCADNDEVLRELAEFEARSKRSKSLIGFATLDGIPTADWLECREIERQLG